MTTAVHIDFETRSELDLREVGLHNYARHPSTSVWCMAHGMGDDEPGLWVPWFDLDPAVRRHVESGGHVYAHNAPFELAIWNNIMAPRYGWPVLRPEQTFCTMAMGYAMGLPGALEDVALALGVNMQKDMEGRALMLRYARPWRRDPTQWLDACPQFTQGGQKYTGAEGLARIHEYSLPLESARMQDLYGRNSTVGKILIVQKELVAGRITVVLVKENLGF